MLQTPKTLLGLSEAQELLEVQLQGQISNAPDLSVHVPADATVLRLALKEMRKWKEAKREKFNAI